MSLALYEDGPVKHLQKKPRLAQVADVPLCRPECTHFMSMTLEYLLVDFSATHDSNIEIMFLILARRLMGKEDPRFKQGFARKSENDWFLCCTEKSDGK